MTYWLGLDIGTSSLKAVALNADGDVRARASVPYRGVDTIGEQDPRSWEDAAREAIAEVRGMSRFLEGHQDEFARDLLALYRAVEPLIS